MIAVVARNTNLLGVRTPSRLELSYLQTAGELTQMIAHGALPVPGPALATTPTPRGSATGSSGSTRTGGSIYASPNALSVYRRLGPDRRPQPGSRLADVDPRAGAGRGCGPTRRRSARCSAAGCRATPSSATAQASLILRSIPLRPTGEHTGGLVLLRDVTDLRRRDRELVTKDATIREIHHRVKNNLQTVAALLRLQARRIDVPEGRLALEEAVRRVGSIAIVHETLSQRRSEEERSTSTRSPTGSGGW